MKKFLFLFSGLLFISTLVYSQGSWTQKASLSGHARQISTGVVCNGKAYIWTGDAGVNGGNIKDFWEYDPTGNTWTQLADFPGTGRRMASCYVYTYKVYLGLGASYVSGAYSYFNDLYEYNTLTNTWTQKANFTGTARRDAVSFVIGSKGYLGLGFKDNNIYFNDLWEYDPATDTWSQKANFPGAARAGAVCFAIGRTAYVGTGMSSVATLNDFWVYDQITDTWTQKASMPGAARRYATGFSLLDYGFIGTGWTGTQNCKDFWMYNSINDSWSQIADLPASARDGSIGFSAGNYGYVGLGIYNGSYNYLKDLWQYTPSGLSINKESNDNSQFVVQPALANEYIEILSQKPAKYYITGINGRILLKGNISVQNHCIKANISNLTPGRYFVVIESDGTQTVKSFIKL